MRLRVLAMALALGALAPNAVNAGVTFSYVTDAPSYNATAGSSAPITVNVYLQEVVTASSTPINDGITSFGIYVKQTNTTAAGQSTIASFTPVATLNSFSSTGNLPGNQLDFYGAQNVTTSSGQALIFVPGSGTSGAAGTYRLQVGTLAITPGTLAGTTAFGLTSTNNPSLPDPPYPPTAPTGPGGTDSTFTFTNGWNLDAGGTFGGQSVTGANTAAFTPFSVVTTAAVPEPGSMILTGLAGSVIGLGVWLRRRRAPVATNDAA